MQSVSYESFTKKVSESIFILTLIVLFILYKIATEDTNYEVIAIGAIALASILSVARLKTIAEKTVRRGHYHMSFIESILVGDIIIIGLGLLGLYIFFVKGLYGMYQLIEYYSLPLLLLRAIIIILSFRLVLATNKIQTVYKSMEADSFGVRDSSNSKSLGKIVKNTLFILLGLLIAALAGQLGREFGHHTTEKFLESTSSIEEELPWFTNSYYGFAIETPFELERVEAKIPEGSEAYIDKMRAYVSKKGGTPIMVLYMESSYEAYDVTKGLRGSISNMVHTMEGANLELDFQKLENGQDDVMCSGRFAMDQDQWILKGYCYWNEEGKILIATAFGKDNKKSNIVLVRTMKSIATNF